MKSSVKHVLLPSLLSIGFIGIASTPVAVIGCRNRGLLALILAFAGAIGALVTSAIGAKARRLGDDDRWKLWLISTIILMFPPIALLILA